MLFSRACEELMAPGHVTVKYFLSYLDIGMLTSHDSHETVIKQQSSLTGHFKFIARFTATGDPFI